MFRTMLLAACAAGCCALPCAARGADSTSIAYALVTPPSAIEIGCQNPCDCATITYPTFGSFTLVLTGADPLYTYYDVERYIASFNNGPGAVAITGSGHFRIGGEVALVQQLTLDLSVEGGPLQHFDSGLVPVTAPFPRLAVSCAVHGFYCYDSVLVVNAYSPAVDGTPPDPSRPLGLQAVRPNPSRGVTSFAFTLAEPAEVDLTVLDVAGRQVRTLAAGLRMGAGEQGATWDGRRDDGRVAPAGVYWVRLRWSGRADQRRFVRAG